MSEYPKVINVGGIVHTVKNAKDEAFWRGGVTVSAPETFAADVPQSEPVAEEMAPVAEAEPVSTDEPTQTHVTKKHVTKKETPTAHHIGGKKK